MKKLLLLATLTVGLALPSTAATPFVRSFLAPGVSSILVTNGHGWTNMNTVAQTIGMGLYVQGTNAVQGNLNAPIATNYILNAYSNSVPFVTNGVTFPGMLVVITNNNTTYPWSQTVAGGGTVLYGPGTNGALPGLNGGWNVFQDVPLPWDVTALFSAGAWATGAAGPTNSLGLLTVVSMPDTRVGIPMGAGGGSNQVTLTFVGIPNQAGGIGNSASPVGFFPNIGSPGSSLGLEVTDAAGAAVANGLQSWSFTYTNQIALLGQQTVFSIPVPAWRFANCQAIRLRSVTPDVATNGVWITSITLTGLQP